MSAHTIHHVTAVTANIQRNLEFYTRVLGLRLVKKSVNQDDTSAYHLFYSDAVGTPGMDMTFFDWPMSAPNVAGGAQVALTSFRVPEGALDFWADRLKDAGVSAHREDGRILFADEEGQRLALVEDQGYPSLGEPWTKEVPASAAIRTIHGVDLASVRPDSTAAVLKQILGYEEIGGGEYRAGDDAHEALVRIVGADRVGMVGRGGVHHVAFRVADQDELIRTMERVESAGLRTSGEIDRFYFRSVYFREPGGVLFELATDGPGFASDEPQESLGEKLALPPFLEPRRAEIEAKLKPLAAV